MKTSTKSLFQIFLFFLLVTLAHAQTRKPIVASDLMKIATTGGIQISPDGNKAGSEK